MSIVGHFLDSGAYSQKTKALKYFKQTGDRWGYYDSPEFWEYMQEYVNYVKRHEIALDLYANIDVIGNAELSWRNQQWLEAKGIKPLPVIHFGTDPDLKWLKHYIALKYPVIGLGGMAVTGQRRYGTRKWLQKCFEHICNNKQHLPCVKIHGFGLTDYRMMVRYPFFSTDSTTWIKRGAFGEILVPKYNSKTKSFVFNRQPYILGVSKKHRAYHSGGTHLLALPKEERKRVYKWLKEIEIDASLLSTSNKERTCANTRFFCRLQDSVPKWPWAFKKKVDKGFFE